jgi:hypothetical protein
MLEILFLIALVFLIAVLFYKQRRPNMEILQAEESQIEKLPELLEEQQPVILRGISPPKGFTKEGLSKIPRLATFSIGGQPLDHVLANPAILASANGSPVVSRQRREMLADELSIRVWADHLWLPRFSQTTWFGWAVGCLRTEALLGGMGMFRTYAKYTAIMPTDGIYVVSILSRESETFLPTNWQYRYPGSLTPNDTPLVADLKYTDIILRPGTLLCLPPHTVVSLEPKDKEFAAAAIVEYHEPVSLLARSFS